MEEIKKYTCKCKSCNRKFDEEEFQITKDENKCILHCEKIDGWIKYQVDNDIPSIINDGGKYFWEIVLTQKMKKNDYNFSNVVFPYFYEEEIDELTHKTKESFNFFDKDEEYSFNKEVNFENAKFMSKVNFNKIIFEEKVNFTNAKFLTAINIAKAEFKKEVIFDRADFREEVIFNSTKFNSKLSFKEAIINKSFYLLQIDSAELELDFECIKLKNDVIFELYNVKIASISINGIENNANKILFNNVNIYKKLKIHYSNVNNIEFINLDLSKAKMDLVNVSLTKSIWSNVFMGEKLEDRFQYYANKDRRYLRDTFRQIKFALESQGNIIEANKFYALEMKEREKELSPKKDFFEWLVFKFHGLSSNHSQDWTLVLFWIMNINFFYSYLNTVSATLTLVFKILFSLILILVIGCMIVKIPEDDEKKRWLTTIPITMFCYFFYGYLVEKDWLLSEYSKNLNPFSIMRADEAINLGTLLYKITIAYLIYQLIVSIRQNTRRK